MSIVPPDLMYTKEHEWIKTDESVVGELKSATMGITDFAQAALGDIVYVQLPKIGQAVVAGKICGEVESTKSVSEIFSPLTGTITAVNTDILTAAEYELLTA